MTEGSGSEPDPGDPKAYGSGSAALFFCVFVMSFILGMGHEGTPAELEDVKSFILDCLGKE
jgi:hypothetical protein